MQVILTHENSDFDAIASLLGAQKLYPNAHPILPHRVNRNVQAFLKLYGGEFPFVDPETLSRGQHISRVILVDTQSLNYVRGMGKDIKDVLIIDHHTPPETLAEGWRFQGEVLGATTTLLVEALSTRLIPITRTEATLMLAGIYEDTGALTYASTDARDLRAAAWLLDSGASLELATEFLEHPLTQAQQAIYDMLLTNIETLKIDGHPIVTTWAVSPPNVDEEISTLAHKLRELLNPSAVFIAVEINDNTQLVARSSTDDMNVDVVAQHFGGGGHDRAAAALIRQRDVQSVFKELTEILPQFVHPRIKVRDIMSFGVRTVHPNDAIALVSKRMLRTGHEGFPVVDTRNRIVGLVTRNAVDRALQHQWDRKPVHRVMDVGEVSVSPADSIEHVRALMIQSGWGQIPVVERERVIGVVTRTDLIRLPPSEQELERRERVQQMQQAFPKPLLDLIRQIGAKAAEEGYIIYFVGGIVRDLLLKQPIVDVDLVVEGDAITLGRKLAASYGGEVRTHSRFGTVKWLLPDTIWREIAPESPLDETDEENLPDFIDLVTARTEFYEHPTALPLVERSSIKQDLHRRDFTINTLAIRLDPQRWGELLDFYGGLEDLEAGVIRVLHSLSFVDDPTRILRAARFETRLGFQLDPRSEALIEEALPLLDRVTGGRIRHELDLIFFEALPEAVLDRLQALGALQAIEPTLTSDVWLHKMFARLRDTPLERWGLSNGDRRQTLHWLLFLYRVPSITLKHLSQRLLMPRRLSSALDMIDTIPELLDQLQAANKPSSITQLLSAIPIDLIVLAWIISDSPDIQEKIENYLHSWQHIHPVLTGDDLKACGIAPGPVYREIFQKIRHARLDGEIKSREEELEIARRWLQKEKTG